MNNTGGVFDGGRSGVGTSIDGQQGSVRSVMALIRVLFGRRVWIGLGIVLVVGLTVAISGGSRSNAAVISSINQCNGAGGAGTVGAATITCAVTT